MIKLDFCRTNHDSCIYFKEVSSGCFIYLLLHVDDILIACKILTEIQKLKPLLNGEFEIKDLESARKILGIEISKDRSLGKMYLTRKDYLERVLSKFGFMDIKPVLIYMERIPYANLVGSIMYPMVYTRPDLSYAVSIVSKLWQILAKNIGIL